MKIYFYLALSLILMSGVSRVDCSGDGDGPTQASVTLGLQVDVPGSGTAPCERDIDIRLEPVSITGSTGKKTTFTTTANVTTSPELVGGKWVCRYTKKLNGFAVGTWRIRVTEGGWVGECVEELSAGANPIHFTLNGAGCVKGIGWP